ncbi:hypothetical protein H1P_900012 [Hyella patelloides LEGE 07179]|uniref:Uncharacterized protein n=1 Tax=Hyella patelloides LEGE 07179 TaxID=945734 RepID=A0A563W536_9CYAN|nr:hypothetical protein H1P_900012 [Hyella patelloides LEGE 07179]
MEINFIYFGGRADRDSLWIWHWRGDSSSISSYPGMNQESPSFMAGSVKTSNSFRHDFVEETARRSLLGNLCIKTQ